jgi:hypothetical protein
LEDGRGKTEAGDQKSGLREDGRKEGKEDQKLKELEGNKSSKEKR